MDMTLNFEKAETLAADRLYEILKACGQDMKTRFGLTHWDPLYPLEFFKKDVLAGKVHAVSDDGELIATFTMSVEPLVYYLPKLWSNPSMVAMYVNHMAVLPEYQGKGVDLLMSYEMGASAVARGMEFGESNRELETNTKIQALWKFHEKRLHRRSRVYRRRLMGGE